MDDAAMKAALGRATRAMVGTVRGLEPGRPVPTCPDWDVTQLVDHLGRVHLWAEAAVRTGAQPDPYPRRDRSQDLAQWYAASADALLATLGDRHVSEPAWSFSGDAAHRTVGFWLRRQFHETSVHHVDALCAAGEIDLSGVVSEVPGLTGAEAADGVAEVMDVFVPRMLARRSEDAPVVLSAAQPVAFVCSDVDASWTLGLVDGAPVVRPGITDDAVAVVRGPATHLYLALWHRADTAGLEVEGDSRLARRLLEASLVP